MDELGVMERGAEKFCAAARAIISGDKPYLVVIQQRALDFWLGGIRHGEVVIITLTNRK
jgi:nucleoside-triphosphatase THEP1